jgi:DNA-binding transcriptional MocR family regulator
MTKPRSTLWQPEIKSGTRPAYQQIVNQIKADLAAGRLQPGDRMPTQRQLSQSMNIALGTITRAYKLAMAEGLLSATVGRGTVVSKPKSGQLLGMPDSNLIEMSVDLPFHSLDPPLTDALRKISRQSDIQTHLRYQDHEGTSRHRRAGSAWLERFDCPSTPENVLVCAGAHHAVTVSMMTIARANDVIACDELNYPGMRVIVASLGLRLNPIEDRTSRFGAPLSLSVLDAICRRQQVKALYCNPSLHNPTTAHFDASMRKEIAQLARKHDFFVIEDDSHRTSVLDPPPPIATILPERTFYIASFSKAVAAGLRVAFLLPPAEWVQRATDAIWATVWRASSLPVEVAATWIESGVAEETVGAKITEARARQELLSRRLPGLEIATQPASNFAWMRLPEVWTSAEFAAEARRRGVAVSPSTAFVAGSTSAPAAVRICLGAPETREQVQQGLEILARLLNTGPQRDQRPAV